MASTHPEPEKSSYTDSLRFNHFVPNHVLLNDSVVNFGKVFLNTPYHYGSPGISSFDCSGFTSHVYRNFGYNLERSSADQAKQFDSIDRTRLKAGDLVFFSGRRKSKRVGHVGIVTAAKENGEFDFIHAAVHSGVTISNSNEEYYTKRFIKASRVIGANQMFAMSKFVAKSDRFSNNALAFTPVSTPVQTMKRVIPAKYHHVKSGETLSSISKEYGMTVEELKQRNDIKGNKLRLKQSIKIKDEETVLIVQAAQPKAEASAVAENDSKNNMSSRADKNNAIAMANNTHSVKKGETLFSISKIYNMSIDELKNINKIIKEKIHPGQQLKISQPTNQPRNEVLANVDRVDKADRADKADKVDKVEETQKTTTHKVISGESLYSIAKTHNIPVDELKRINNIQNGKIHPGQELRLNQEAEVKRQTLFADKSDDRHDNKIKNSDKMITHIIKRGENLGSIAKENNTTVEELKRINNLSDSKIHQGQELKINEDRDEINRNAVAQRITRKQDAKIESNEKMATYKVRKGDNLGSIAKENNITLEELKRINNLSDSKIHQGQELKINEDRDDINRNAVAQRITKKKDVKIESNEKMVSYKVRKGDNLGSIAKENNTTVEELKRINNLSDSKIHQGQELKVNEDRDDINRNALAQRITKKQDIKIESNEKMITHKVKKGDNLGSIAKENNTTVEELKRINNLTDAKIRLGQELKLNQSLAKTTTNSPKAEKEPKSIQHEVKSGESFYTIAKKYGCTVEKLKDWNRKTGSKIKVGEKISINEMASK